MHTKIISYITHQITLSPGLIRDITSSVYHTITVFNNELTFFYKQAAIGPAHHSFQLLCFLDKTFAGYCYMETDRKELRLTGNNISNHPWSYQWNLFDRTFDLARIRELNKAQGNTQYSYALYVEPAFRSNSPSLACTGFGTLLLKASLCIGQEKHPSIKKLRVFTLKDRLSFYEKILDHKKRFSFLYPVSLLEMSVPFRATMDKMDTCVTLKKKN